MQWVYNMKTKKGKNLFLMSGLLLTILITGCSTKNNHNGNKENVSQKGTSDNMISKLNKTLDEAMKEILSGDIIAVVYDSDDRNINIGANQSSYHITFDDNNIELSDNSIGKIAGSKITIQKPGNYVISGTLNEGQIIVNSEKSGIVHLIFDGVSITAKNSTPLYIKNSSKTVLTLNKDTNNYLIDSDIYEYDNIKEGEPDAALFSKGNLTINGSGNLTVSATFNDGITSKKELKIVGSNITVKAKEDGVKSEDYLAIESGTISVSAGGDGLRSTNSNDPSLGYVVIDGGIINMKASNLGIHAETSIKVNNGTVNITSKKDGMHAPSNVYVHDGKLDIISGMDGIQGDKSIYITGGELNLTSGGSSISGKGIKATEEVNVLGGTILIDSTGNAIHSNQLVNIYDGAIMIQSGADSIYAGESLALNGGDLIAIGSSENPVTSSANTSSQYAVLVNYERTQKANTLLHIEDEEGNEIITYAPTKNYKSLVISSSSLKKGGTYKLYSGGSVTGEELNDLYTNETYSDGKLVKSFEITSITTHIIIETN